MSDSDGVKTQISGEVARLTEQAARSTGVCLVAKMIAVSDEGVIDLLVRKLAEGNVPRGVRCLGREEVLFEFDCPPGVFCLISPSFLVRVSLSRKVVTEIVDPFDPADLHFELTGAGSHSLIGLKHFTATAASVITGSAKATAGGNLLAGSMTVRRIGEPFAEVKAMGGTGAHRRATISVSGSGVYEVGIDVTAAPGTEWEASASSGSSSDSSGKRIVSGGSDFWGTDLTVS